MFEKNFRKNLMVQMFFVTLHRLEGEISSRRCISLLFRTLPKRPEKPIWNKFDLKSEGKGQEKPFLLTNVAMHHAWAWKHSYM